MEGGWRPSSASSTPAFCRDSLYFIIAAIALGSGMAPGAAFSYPLGITSIINRIVNNSLTDFGSNLDRPGNLSYLHVEPGAGKSTVLARIWPDAAGYVIIQSNADRRGQDGTEVGGDCHSAKEKT